MPTNGTERRAVAMVKLLERLFQTHYQDVYRYLYSLTRDAALSEDL